MGSQLPLNVGPNRQAYMGYRVRYAVETGENHTVNIYNGDIISKKKDKVNKISTANTQTSRLLNHQSKKKD
ncbi:hypothetical protein [Peribacillus sp. ACCC06369]|uniref:hypothetical protein n=1 Tax=Peribacillus sp. ACCC06369 TaxID=3055860 RepID=UPI0025A1219B|nr:hypothetical protein [Peribacillus sp. ACCC06369]